MKISAEGSSPSWNRWGFIPERFASIEEQDYCLETAARLDTEPAPDQAHRRQKKRKQPLATVTRIHRRRSRNTPPPRLPRGEIYVQGWQMAGGM
jgi:hypothetical protein